jgi:hypothetical protein
VAAPQIAIDANGNAIAVWPQPNGDNYTIWSNHYTPSIGWGTPAPLEPDASTGASDSSIDPQIKLDANGNAIAVWVRSDNITSHVWSNRYVAGNGWTMAVPIDDNAVNAGTARIAFDTSGNAIAVWDQSDAAGSFHMWAKRYTAATSAWGSEQMIPDNDTVQAFDAQIAIDTAGNALLVWAKSDGLLRPMEIWASRYTAGDWSIAGRISDPLADVAAPQVALDANGNAIAVWHQIDSNSTHTTTVRWNRYTTGGGWGTPAPIETNDASVSVGDPEIASDPSGNTIAVWLQLNGAHSEIRSSRYTVGGGWAPSVNAGSTADDILGTALAMDSAGNAIAVWQEYDSSNISLLWANRFE